MWRRDLSKPPGEFCLCVLQIDIGQERQGINRFFDDFSAFETNADFLLIYLLSCEVDYIFCAYLGRNFRLKKFLIGILAFVMLTAFFMPTYASSTNQNVFTDVGENMWYSDAVRFVTAEGIMRGISDTTFSPYGTMSRAMIATTLYRLAGEPAVAFASVFHDVSEGAWFSDAVIWASNNQIVNGVGGGRFAPDDHVTREQIATLLFRFAAFLGMDVNVPGHVDLSQYNDRSQISTWALESMTWAVYRGLIMGYNRTTLAPRNTATRAQCAMILYRFATLNLPDPPGTEPPNGTAPEMMILTLVNAARTEHGLAPLQWHNDLASLARAHSKDMWQRGFFAHTCPSGISSGQRIRNAGIEARSLGENLLRGLQSPERTFAAWMDSPPHRSLILTPDLTHIGVGHVQHNQGGWDNFWTMKLIGV